MRRIGPGTPPFNHMILDQKLIVVMPAYNAAKTLEATYRDIPRELVDEIILVDDASQDETIRVAKALGLTVYSHDRNRGYGGNQKSCYRLALERNADIVVMLHPDYQYDPRLIAPMAGMIASGAWDMVMGSRILASDPACGGMPRYKYIANRVLTFIQNQMLSAKLSEYHTGYRAYHRRVLETLPLAANGDDFVFDNQLLAQAIFFNFRIGEISCPAKYFPEASSIGFFQSVKYGQGVLRTSLQFVLEKMNFAHFPLFERKKSDGFIEAEKGKPVLIPDFR